MSQLVQYRSQPLVELSVMPGTTTLGADHRSHQHRGLTMGTAVRPAKTSPGPWDAFADVDAFVDEVLAELEAMAKDGSRPVRSGPKPPLVGAALRKAVMAIWCVGFCGMQWRAVRPLCQVPFRPLYGLFARGAGLACCGAWLDGLRRRWRLPCGDAPEPSGVVIDSRSCRSAPSCF